MAYAFNVFTGKFDYYQAGSSLTIPVTLANGGTGLSSYTQGDIPYFTSGTAFSKLAKNTNAIRYISNQGVNNAPSWDFVNLTNGVTGTLPVSKGGTGLTVSTAGQIYFGGGSSFVQTDKLYWDNALNRLSVQAGTSPEAVGHFKSDTLETISGLSGASATLTVFNLPTAPSVASATQTAGHLYAANSPTSTESFSGSAYNNGDVIDYQMYAYNSDSGTFFSIVYAQASPLTITSGSSDVDISWSNNTTGTSSISGYVILRQVNGGGFNTGQDVGNVNFWHDDGTGWGGASVTPTFPDFLANGSNNFSYDAYSQATTPASTFVYSATSTPYTFLDNNDGNPFAITHAITPSGASSARSVKGGSTHYDGTNFIEYTNTYTGGAVVTPTTYGYLSDGSILNRSYQFYRKGTVGSTVVYSPTAITASSVDPSDGNYYYIILGFSPAVTAKILRNINGAGYNSGDVATTTVYDDGLTAFSDGTTVTPTGAYAGAGLFEAHGSSSLDSPTLALRSLDGNYSRLDFLNSSNVRQAFIESDSGTLKLDTSSSGAIYLNYNGSTRMTISSTGLGFFGTVAAQQASGVDLGVALSNLGLRASGSYPITTSSTVTFTDNNIVLGTTTGTKFGTSTTQKLAFYNSTPIVQSGATTDLGVVLSDLGLRAVGTNYPITTGGNVTFGSLNVTRIPIVGTAGLLTDSADLTFSGSTLTATGLVIGTTKLTSYNGVSTVRRGMASEVASSDLTAQSAAIAATTLYAVPTTGWYRVSWTATITTAATTSSILGGATGFQLKFTSPTDSVVKTQNPTNITSSAGNTTATMISGTENAYCKTGTNLQYIFGYTSVGVTAMQYELHITAEAL